MGRRIQDAEMKSVSVIGAGKVGTCLGHALSRKGYIIRAVSDARLAAARESAGIIGQGRPTSSNTLAAGMSRIIFLCVPDDRIEKAVQGLSRSRVAWPGKHVFHSSGLLSSAVLRPLRDKGARTASLHPVQSFARKQAPPEIFKDIYFGVEGDPEAVNLAHRIIHKLGSHTLFLTEKDKPRYHAACNAASNNMAIILDMAFSLLQMTGLDEKQSANVLMPLVKGTLQNVKEIGVAGALTGPVMRGDAGTVARHLEVLEPLPFYRELYVKLSLRALEYAGEKGLPAEKIKALAKILRDK